MEFVHFTRRVHHRSTCFTSLVLVTRAFALSALFAGPVASALDGGVTVPPSDAPTTDAGTRAEELEELERALEQDRASRSKQQSANSPAPVISALQSMNPDMSFVADVALGWFSTDKPLQSGAHDPSKTGFNLQQLEMSVQSAVDPFFRFDAFVVFGQFGVEIEEAYATTLALPGNLQARVGQFLTRFGRLNATHPHAWDFVDQPFALGRVFGGEANRGVGLEVSYLAPLDWYFEVVASATDAAGEATARSFYGGEDLGVVTPLDLQSLLAVKQFFPLSDDWSLLWGVSAASGPNPTGHANRTEVVATDVYLKYRPVTQGGQSSLALQTEWLYRRRQVPRDVLADVSGYVFLAWRFDKRWGTALRYEFGSPARTRGGETGGDWLDPFWTGDRHRASAALTFWPTEFSRIRLQLSSDVLTWERRANWAAFLAFEFSVGAHGAHPF